MAACLLRNANLNLDKDLSSLSAGKPSLNVRPPGP